MADAIRIRFTRETRANEDIVVHTATVKGAWDVMLAPGKSASRVFDTPGVIAYICRFHPNMTGHISVVANENAATGDR